MTPSSIQEAEQWLALEAAKPGAGVAKADRAIAVEGASDYGSYGPVDRDGTSSMAAADSPTFRGQLTVSHFHCDDNGCDLNSTITAYQVVDLYYERYRVNSRTGSQSGWAGIKVTATCAVLQRGPGGPRPPCHGTVDYPKTENAFSQRFVTWINRPHPGLHTVRFAATRHGLTGTKAGNMPVVYCRQAERQCKFDYDGDGGYE